MAWTPTIQTTEKTNGKLRVVIKYTDGTITFYEDVILSTPTTLNDIVANRVTQLAALDTYALTLVNGAAISTVPTPTAILTQAEIDRNAWLVNYRKLVKAKQTLVDIGVIPASQPIYAALLATVQSGLQASYLDYI